MSFMNKKPLILIGSGGHCRSCIDVIESTHDWYIHGILDEKGKYGNSVLGHKIIADDSQIRTFAEEGYYFLIAVGQIKNSISRRRIYKSLIDTDAKLATVVSPYAYVSRHSNIGLGTIIHHFAFINANVNIGNNCIINTGAVIEHDSQVGNHTHISTNSTINGTVCIGERCFVGSGAVIRNNISIVDDVIIGAASLVSKNIIEPGTYLGSPANRITNE